MNDNIIGEISNLKLFNSKKFEDIINHVDVDTETLIKFQNETTNNSEIITKLNEKREAIIKKINEIKNYNHENITSKFNEIIMEEIFKKYCVYFPSILFSEFQTDEASQYGILLTTDFYISDENVDLIKQWINTSQYTIEYDKSSVNGLKVKVKPILMEVSQKTLNVEYILIAEMMMKSLCNNECLVEICKKDMEKIEEMKLLFPASSTYELDFSPFKNLKNLHTFPLGSTINNASNLKHLKMHPFYDFDSREYISPSSKFEKRLIHLNFENNSSLEELDMSYSGIRKLAENTFKNCSNLKSLNLDGNFIEEISANSFNGLDKLEKLTMTLTKPNSLTEIRFQDISNLRFLNLKILSNTDFKLILKWFSILEKLENLSICVDTDISVFESSNHRSNNEIQLIESLFSNPVDYFEKHLCLKMISIKIEYSNGQEIIFEYERDQNSIRLTRLVINDNFCRKILSRHTFFDIDINLKKLLDETVIPDAIEQDTIIDPSRLKHLKLTLLQIKTTKGLDSLESLEEENIEFPNYSPKEFLKECTTLNTLELRLCDIYTLENGLLDKLCNLKILDLRYNKLQTIEKSAFNKLINLESLDLSHNSLTSIENSLFDNLSNLKSLNLESDKLVELDVSLFKYLTKLTTLNLMWNNLVTLDKDIFKSLKQLEKINLSHNRLRSFDGLFEGLSNLNEINVFGNYGIESMDWNQFIKLEKLSKLSLPEIIVNDKRHFRNMKYLINNKRVNIIGLLNYKYKLFANF